MPYSPFMANFFCLHRDGRDIIVSLYYHSLFQNDKNSPLLVDRTRRDLGFSDCDDIQHNLPKFIDYVYDRDIQSRSPYRFSWPQFVNGWEGKGGVHLKYEDLINNGLAVIAGAIETVTGKPVDNHKLAVKYEKYSFQNQSKRQPGEEKKTSFLRKGTPGDWRQKFDSHSAKSFQEYAGKELISYGYESDGSWVDLWR